MKKNLLLRLCLILIVAITAYSCRTDQFPETQPFTDSSKFQLTSKRISLDESKHRSILLPELEKAKVGINAFSKTNVNGRVIDYGNGVSIDTNDVIYIENGPNYHTYTFNIKRGNAIADAPVENLVLSPMADGTYKEVLVAYHLTPAEKETLNNGGLVETKGKTIITELADGTYSPLAKGMTSCGWTETYTVMGCSDVHNGVSTHNAGNVESWGGCKADRKPGLYMTMTYRCDFTGMTDDIGNPNSPPGGSSGSSGGGSSTGETGSNNDNNDPGNNTSPCPNGGTLTSPPTLTTDPGDGNCSGIPTQINLPNRTTPCQRLKNLFDPAKANIKPLITNGMYNHINNNPTGEGGVNLKRDANGNYSSDISPYTNTNMANILTGGYYYAAIHTHPNDTYPMFSWSDIYVAYKLIMNSTSSNRPYSALLLVCEDDNGVKQTYAITFESIGLMMEDVFSNPENIGCTQEEIKNRMDLILEDKYKKEADKNNPDYESAFLQMTFGTNIGLYKANNNLTGFSKLQIASNTPNAVVSSTQCN